MLSHQSQGKQWLWHPGSELFQLCLCLDRMGHGDSDGDGERHPDGDGRGDGFVGLLYPAEHCNYTCSLKLEKQQHECGMPQVYSQRQ